MFDVSWGEMGVVVGLGLFLIGRKDLPHAARVAGTQVGRVVGLLQGARARADQFAQTNELRALHNEVKSGLRELDHVRAELAVSLSPSQMVQGQRNNLGSMVPSANRMPSSSGAGVSPLSSPSYSQPPFQNPTTTTTATSFGSTSTRDNNAKIGSSITMSSSSPSLIPPPPPPQQEHSDYKSHASIAAVAEEEWIKQGIHFQSRAEQRGGSSYAAQQQQGAQQQHQQQQLARLSGSALLANSLQQSLIFDQYDRVLANQEASMQNRMQSIQEKVQQQQQQKDSDDNNKKKDDDKKKTT